MDQWIPRSAEGDVKSALRRSPAVLLLGARQVGKSTLARRLVAEDPAAAVYLDLERTPDRQRLQDADAYLRAAGSKLLVIDEVHRAPELFDTLRGVIDERRFRGDRYGHFLLLGSASIELLRQTESLAGRISSVEMTPVLLNEAAGAGLTLPELWLRGGFPDSLTARDTGDSLLWRGDFIRSYLERDVPMFAPRLPAETIGRLWTMLAHVQGAPLNKERLAASLEVSASALNRYLDLLVDLLLVRRLRPWSGNVGKRLVRAPKIYIRDSGLVHALLDVAEYHDLLGHPVVGPSWEGFVIEHLIAAAGWRCIPYYYRTHSGAEIDLLFERGGRVEAAIEIKRSAAASVSRGFHAGCAVLQPRARYLVHGADAADGADAAEDTWPAPGGVTVIGLRALAERLAGQA